MNIVRHISYDTDLTLENGVYRYYMHEMPCIGLAINKYRQPILYILTDHSPNAPVTEKILSFYKNENDAGLRISSKHLDWDDIIEAWEEQDLATMLEEKTNVIDEVLDYPILLSKFDFIKSLIETQPRIKIIQVVVDDLETLNSQLSKYLQDFIEQSDVDNISDIELSLLIEKNELNYFDLCNILEWGDTSMSISDFPLKSKEIFAYEAEIVK